jgi:hypothetical protein
VDLLISRLVLICRFVVLIVFSPTTCIYIYIFVLPFSFLICFREAHESSTKLTFRGDVYR